MLFRYLPFCPSPPPPPPHIRGRIEHFKRPTPPGQTRVAYPPAPASCPRPPERVKMTLLHLPLHGRVARGAIKSFYGAEPPSYSSPSSPIEKSHRTAPCYGMLLCLYDSNIIYPLVLCISSRPEVYPLVLWHLIAPSLHDSVASYLRILARSHSRIDSLIGTKVDSIRNPIRNQESRQINPNRAIVSISKAFEPMRTATRPFGAGEALRMTLAPGRQ